MSAQKTSKRQSRVLSLYLMVGVTAVAVGIISLNVKFFLERQKVGIGVAASEGQNGSANAQHVEYWQKLVADHPTYRDGFLELAQYAYEDGNLDLARAYIKKAKSIDPNSPKVAQLEKKVN
jgi:Tfp pilus assembly protein PilF